MKRIMMMVAGLVLAITSMGAVVTNANADRGGNTNVCTGYEHKVDGLSGFTYNIPVTPGETVTSWCVKFGQNQRTGTGNVIYIGDQKHEISHVAWNDEPVVPTDDPTDPTTVPTDDPTEPTDSPTDPTSEPTDDPTTDTPTTDVPTTDVPTDVPTTDVPADTPTTDVCKGRPIIGGPCAPVTDEPKVPQEETNCTYKKCVKITRDGTGKVVEREEFFYEDVEEEGL